MVITNEKDFARYVDETEKTIKGLSDKVAELSTASAANDSLKGEVAEYKTKISNLETELNKVIADRQKSWASKSEDEKMDTMAKFFLNLKHRDYQKVLDMGGRFVSNWNAKDGEWAVKAAPDLGTPLRGDAVTGSVLVPAEWESSVLMKPFQEDPLLSLVTQVNMNQRTVYYPKESTDLAFVEVTNEVTAKTESVPAVEVLTLTARPFATWLGLTEELMEDSAIDLVSYFTSKFGKAWSTTASTLAWTALTTASGVSTYTMSAGRTTGASIVLDDILELRKKITDQNFRNNAVLLLHCTLVDQLAGKKDGEGNYILGSVNGFPTIFGMRFVTTSAAPDITAATAGKVIAAYLDPSLVVIGTRRGLSVRLFDQTIDTMVLDRDYLRAKVRADADVSFPGGIALLKTSAS